MEGSAAAELLVMPTPEECKARLTADGRRPWRRVQEHLKVVDAWFAAYTSDPSQDEVVRPESFSIV